MCNFGGQSEIKADSERQFGLFFAGIFLVVGLWPMLDGSPVRWWAFGVAGVFLLAALLRPRTLIPFNRLWFKLGLALASISAPVAMSLVFYLALTPTALIMRVLGKDPLRLKMDRSTDSYWITRDHSAEMLGSMRNQF